MWNDILTPDNVETISYLALATIELVGVGLAIKYGRPREKKLEPGKLYFPEDMGNYRPPKSRLEHTIEV